MGCNFPNCPRTSIYEASERDYKIVLVEDAVSGLNPKDKDEMIAIGVQVIPAETVLNNIVELRESSRQP
jgi:nicotinamidase-related amidase